jgi:hypothetical protein
MQILEFIGEVAKAMVPPPDSAPTKLYWYHFRVAAVSCTAFLGVLFFTAIAFGRVPGFGGFALAADLQVLSIHVVDSELLNLRVHHCVATTPDAKQLYWDRISTLMVEYRRLSRVEYVLPTCGDL